MLDSGADADRAVSEAGSRLARDRGSADVGGAKWALAVLGYATGKVSDAQVRSYRTQHASLRQPPPAGSADDAAAPAAPGSAPAPPRCPSRPPRPRPRRTVPVRRPTGGMPPQPPNSPPPRPAATATPLRARSARSGRSWSVAAGRLVVIVGGGIGRVVLSGATTTHDDPGAATSGPHHVRDRGPGRVLRRAQRALPEPRRRRDVGHGQLCGRGLPVRADREDPVHVPERARWS